jgi:hypothetical protein
MSFVVGNNTSRNMILIDQARTNQILMRGGGEWLSAPPDQTESSAIDAS